MWQWLQALPLWKILITKLQKCGHNHEDTPIQPVMPFTAK
ncbi:hypothetical protein VHA_001349 [Grimontia hollisae CIP 101886]|uniref:Uncharacterized protein n=1 Tax=Grimontia hollisae CIP 101886 TaxID=675812 RepID=D0I6I2_GRIHO|nr:hypothetical protein VHA_001349 [Grimontia hollisae CIP 101886]